MIQLSVTKKISFIVLLLSFSIITNAQISVNTTGETANGSAMLDVSSTDKGMLIPRMTTAQRTIIVNPADGLLVFDTNTDSFWYYNSTAVEWQKVGNAVAGASELNDLSDAIYDGSSLFIGAGSGSNDDNTDNRNTAVGRSSLYSNTSGITNTAIGNYSLYSNTTGSVNTANGNNSLFSNTTGMSNTASGSQSLYSNLAAGYNTASGSQSLFFNTMGSQNTAIGAYAAHENILGNNNVSFGFYSDYYNQYGINNTIIGSEAGRGSSVHSRSGSVFLGYQAGYYETGSNKLYIENSNSSSPLIGGDFANDSLFFNGVVRITGGNPGANKLLTSDADGNATWQVNTAASELNELSDAIYDGSSLFIGEGAGVDDDHTMNHNTAVGSFSFYKNTSGYNNTAIGTTSLVENISGFENIAIGFNSLGQNITGWRNTVVGNSALSFNTNGTNNISFGYQADYNNQSGNNNTIIGTEAGRGSSVHSKSGNIFLGYQAGYNETGNNKLYIENTDSSSPLIGGDFANDSLFFNGVVRITGGNPGVNKILTSDANGNATWQDNDGGATELNELNDVKYLANSLYIGVASGMFDDASANNNTALGSNSLSYNTSGDHNTAFGHFSLYKNTTGSNNVTNGYLSLFSNTSGICNIAIGEESSYYNQTGSNNTTIGFQAGRGVSEHSKSGNIFLGYRAGYNETGSNKLYIENTNSPLPLIGGDFANDSLFFNGVVRITGGNPGVNKILTSDTDGNATWEVNAAASELNELSDAIYDGSSLFIGTGSGTNDDHTANENTAVGKNSLLQNTSGNRNSTIGFYSLWKNTTGSNNTVNGFQTLAENTTGSDNTAIGMAVLLNNLTGDGNTAIGKTALRYNTTGSNNTASGYNSLCNNTTASNNTASGYNSLYNNTTGSNNTASGYSSLYHNTTGNYNTANGYESLKSNTTSFYNTASGYQSLYSNTTGNNNTASGYQSLYSNITGLYNTAMGSTALYNNTASDNTAIGYQTLNANTSGRRNVAVGVIALKLNVTGNYNVAVGYAALKSLQSGDYNSAFGTNSLIATTGNRNTGSGYNSLNENTSGGYNTAFGYESGGNNTTGTYNTFLGYNARANNTTAKTNSSAIGNDAIITASNQIIIGNASVTEIGGFTDWTDFSDKRFKINVDDDVSGLDFILKLRPVTYNLDIQKINDFIGANSNDVDAISKKSKIRQSGFLAQEVEKAAQEVGFSFSGVDAPKNENDPYGLRYGQFVVPLVKAVQEQQKIIEQLVQENNELKELFKEVEKLKVLIKNKK